MEAKLNYTHYCYVLLNCNNMMLNNVKNFVLKCFYTYITNNVTSINY